MPETGERITIECSCGKRLKAPSNAVGRKAKCPTCGNVLTISQPQRSLVIDSIPESSDEADGGGDFSALYNLADHEAVAGAAAEASDTSRRCPSCRTPLKPDAV